MEIKIERYRVSRKLKLLAFITTVMGGLFFAYPVFYILSLSPEIAKYRISIILSHLDRIFFLQVPLFISSYVPAEINGYIAFAIIHVVFAILLMIISNFLLERNLLAVAFSFIIFLSLSVSEYFLALNLNSYSSLALYGLFGFLPLVLIIVEIVTEKDWKKEQFYVKIIGSFMIIATMILCFRSLMWLIQNRQWVIDTFS